MCLDPRAFCSGGNDRRKLPCQSGIVSRMRSGWILRVAIMVVAAGAAVRADWPQFLGPQRNGVYSGPPIATTWPASGPRKVWEKRIGQGFAGPVVAGGRAILFHRVGNEEVVDAFDAATGEPRWHFAYPT